MTTLNHQTDEALDRMLAVCLGWQTLETAEGWSPEVCKTHMAKPNEDAIASPPRFTQSLDECARVIKTLTDPQLMLCRAELMAICERNDRERLGYTPTHQRFWHAEPREVAEALVATLRPKPTTP